MGRAGSGGSKITDVSVRKHTEQCIKEGAACSDTDLWPLRDVFGAVADEADGFHAGVWKRGVAGELRQTLDGVLEGVDGGREVLFEYIRCEATTEGE